MCIYCCCCLVIKLWLTLATTKTATQQTSLSFTIYLSLLKLLSIVVMTSSNHFVLCHSLILLSSIFCTIRVFSNGSALHIRRPKYWSFSIHPSNEYSGLISLRNDWLGSPCSPRDSEESSPAWQVKIINFSAISLLYGPILISVHDYWKNHSFD